MIVRVFDRAGQVRHHWEGALVQRSDELVVLRGAWGRALHTPSGEVPIQNFSVECYWPGVGYTVAALFDQSWALREFYARLIRPVELHDGELRFVDLGRHLSVKPDGTYRVVELPTPSTNGTRSADPKGAEPQAAWEALLALAQAREGPFDPAFYDAYKGG